MKRTVLLIIISLAGLGSISAQALDISSGGAPTITGTSGGSVTGSSSVLNNLAVTINFGELSPSNTNNYVKVIVPIAIRSDQAYKITATIAGTANANVNALQKTDVGFGINNWHAMGSKSRVCTQSNHIIYSPFGNDPSSGITTNASGRVQYVSDLGGVTTNTTIISGPQLSSTNGRAADNGYIFNAIFVVTPQFYAAGTASATLTFTISTGPNAPC